MKAILTILFLLIIIVCLLKATFAMNIGVAQPSGTNIGVAQYEAAAPATNTGNFFLLF